MPTSDGVNAKTIASADCLRSLKTLSTLVSNNVYVPANVGSGGYGAALFYHSSGDFDLCVSEFEFELGSTTHVKVYDIRLAAPDGVKVGYLVVSPYPLNVSATHFWTSHHSMYDADGRLSSKKENLKPLLRLRGMFLMTFGEHGLMGLTTACNSQKLLNFLNMR